MDMKQVIKRIDQAMAGTGLDDAKLAAMSGMKKDGIRNWRRGVAEGRKVGATYDNFVGVARALDVDPEWLANGTSLLSATRLELGEATPQGASLVPVYDVAASAGYGALIDTEEVSHTLAFPPDYLRRITSSSPQNLAIISVKGDSMEPTLNDDDIVMLDMSKTSLGYEGLFVIRIYDVLHVKRLSHARPGFIEVISDNRTKYPPREYAANEVEVVGKVLWAGGKI